MLGLVLGLFAVVCGMLFGRIAERHHGYDVGKMVTMDFLGGAMLGNLSMMIIHHYVK